MSDTKWSSSRSQSNISNAKKYENSTKFSKIVKTRKAMLVFIWYFTIYQGLWYGFILLILFILYFWRYVVLAKANISKWSYDIKIIYL